MHRLHNSWEYNQELLKKDSGKCIRLFPQSHSERRKSFDDRGLCKHGSEPAVDVGFNKEIAENCALYWSRKPGNLARLIDRTDKMNSDEIAEMGRGAKKRVDEDIHGTRFVENTKIYLQSKW